jgi:hypothetical protein
MNHRAFRSALVRSMTTMVTNIATSHAAVPTTQGKPTSNRLRLSRPLRAGAIVVTVNEVQLRMIRILLVIHMHMHG